MVYKVDRLTRSLLDFARLVEAFDKAGTSFVSITQSFNTTTSMGRLTLNILLSFAQFEREVTAERIRDKLAASKARGMWMGGTPPLGYRPDGKTLAVVDEHAELVRSIFTLHLELGNVRLLHNALSAKGLVKPVRISKAGRSFGGTNFTRGELYALLSNPIYIGRIRHKDKIHDGLHPPIIAQDTWDAVQSKLAANRTCRTHIRTAAHPSLLIGKLFDDAGEKMVASHASKGARRYRYYVSRGLQHGGDAANTNGLRIPAPEIESLVCARLAELFDNPMTLIEGMAQPDTAPDVIAKAVANGKTLATMLRTPDRAPLVPLIEQIVARVDIAPEAIAISLDSQKIREHLGFGSGMASPSSSLEITVPVRLKRSGMAMRLILPGGEHAASRIDENLIRAIARAHGWWRELMDNPDLGIADLGIADLAARHGFSESWATRMLRLAFLDPAIIERVLDDRAPAGFTLEALNAPDAYLRFGPPSSFSTASPPPADHPIPDRQISR